MMHWVEDLLWWLMGVAAFVCQLVGIIGFIAGIGVIWVRLFD